jgi:hypothetical protein
MRPSSVVVLVLVVIAGSLTPRPSGRATAVDDPRDALRPCTRADLIGTWAMIRLGTAPSVKVDASDPYFYPYQRYAVTADRSMRHLTATVPVGPEEQRTILSAPATITWSVDDSGRLLTRKNGAAAPEVDVCHILLTKISDSRSSFPGFAGDMLLTHYGQDGKPVARRLLRKMSSPDE